MSAKSPPRSRARRVVVETLTILGIIAATPLAIEGVASAWILAREGLDAVRSGPPSRPHARPDSLLGWRNQGGMSNANQYGAGAALTTTAEGFRRTRGVTDSAPATPVVAAVPAALATSRIVCTGDSFTFGVGVGDDRTWCARLGAELPGVETVDVAQDSYGVDQSYLWYREVAPQLGSHVHVMAITNAAVERAVRDADRGWPKPYLALDGERLATRNVPVRSTPAAGVRGYEIRRAFEGLRIVQAIERIPAFNTDRETAQLVDEARPMLERLLAETAAEAQKRGTPLLVVYLPTNPDVRPSARLDARRAWLSASATRLGVPFVDLTGPLRSMRRDSVDLAFFTRTTPGAVGGTNGQYTALGHDWVAQMLAPRLAALPAPQRPGA